MVKNAFGILSSVFRVLKKPMLLQPDIAKTAVSSTIYLHNFLRNQSTSKPLYSPPALFDSEENGEITPGTWRNEILMEPLRNVPRRANTRAKEIRAHLAAHFTTNSLAI